MKSLYNYTFKRKEMFRELITRKEIRYADITDDDLFYPAQQANVHQH